MWVVSLHGMLKPIFLEKYHQSCTVCHSASICLDTLHLSQSQVRAESTNIFRNKRSYYDYFEAEPVCQHTYRLLDQNQSVNPRMSPQGGWIAQSVGLGDNTVGSVVCLTTSYTPLPCRFKSSWRHNNAVMSEW